MARFILDIETDGLLDVLTVVHCVVLRDIDTDHVQEFYPGEVERALPIITEADLIVGHNVIGFDIPALKKVFPGYPGWAGIDQKKVLDTLLIAKIRWGKDLLWPLDRRLANAGRIPKNMMGRQSLEAWGYRLGENKGDYKGPWHTWSREMQDYCVQDTKVTLLLWKRLMKERADGNITDESIDLEHSVRWIIDRQERRGVSFDAGAAKKLYLELAERRQAVERELREKWFPPWWKAGARRCPTAGKLFTKAGKPAKTLYVAGAPYTVVKYVEFNPASDAHIEERLRRDYGWVPSAFTPSGQAKTSEEVLEKVNLPPVKALLEFAMLEKRMGQIADGKEGWLKHVTNVGRIHGRVDSNSCVSGRMSHSKPNLGQVPSRTKRDGTVQPYGRECRRLFLASPGYKLVGIDADALELVCLAGYMSPWDGGAYIRAQTTGRKEDGTDPHSLNAAALGGVPRDMAKQWFYAMLYGAGNPALGVYLGAVGKVQKLARIGKDKRELFMRNMPALKGLVETIHKRVEGAGYLKALDGRRLFIRAKHAAINQLLQSAGAILMKRALIILDADLQARGLVPGEDYEFVLNVHDEWQIEALPARAKLVGERGVAAITAAGEYYKFPCPVSGSYKIGDSWDETH